MGFNFPNGFPSSMEGYGIKEGKMEGEKKEGSPVENGPEDLGSWLSLCVWAKGRVFGHLCWNGPTP